MDRTRPISAHTPLRSRLRSSLTISAIGALVLGGTLITGGIPAAAVTAKPSDPGGDPSAYEAAMAALPEESRVIVPFQHAVSLEDATSVTEIEGTPVLAYRYENPEVVGEYSVMSDQTPAEFLESFDEYYGTAPEVTAAIIMRPTAEVMDSQSLSPDARKAPQELSINAPAFVAPPVPAESPAAIASAAALARASQSSANASDKHDSPTVSSSAMNDGTWYPDYTDYQIFDVGSYGMYFQQFITWYDLSTSPHNLQDHWGLEFQIDIFTNHPDYQGGSRPNCNSGYKQRPFASNANGSWNWSVYIDDAGPAGLVPAPATYGAYADYNDLSDPCNRNSMAIGIADPHAMVTDGWASYVMQLNIIAPKGLDSSGRISSQVQAVSRHWCEWNGGMTFTDCMGVYPASWGGPEDPFYITLGEWRNWTAPPKCWQTNNYNDGSPIVPIPYQC